MSYQRRVYRTNGTYWISEFRDDSTRTVTTYDEPGAVLNTRPYTAAENATADVAAVDSVATANAATIETSALAALAANKTFVAIAAPTTAQNAAQIKALSRQVNGLNRLVLRRLDATD